MFASGFCRVFAWISLQFCNAALRTFRGSFGRTAKSRVSTFRDWGGETQYCMILVGVYTELSVVQLWQAFGKRTRERTVNIVNADSHTK